MTISWAKFVTTQNNAHGTDLPPGYGHLKESKQEGKEKEKERRLKCNCLNFELTLERVFRFLAETMCTFAAAAAAVVAIANELACDRCP